MPYSANAIAYAFVQKGIQEGKFVTQMKLQKMVYFAHGYHLAKYGEPLIREEFEAWKFGPVIPDIYQSYKLYGSDPIFDTDLISRSTTDVGKPAELSESAKDALEYTWRFTKRLSATQLSHWTHLAGSPWALVYNPNEWSIPIKNESIKEYFKELLTARED
jgi:uncharacterized phage-associated protein